MDPFIGIGSTAYVCVETGRDCIGFELKDSYHRLAESNTRKAFIEFRSGQQDLSLDIADDRPSA
jgi:tRNA G10  N-methylase Trm11